MADNKRSSARHSQQKTPQKTSFGLHALLSEYNLLFQAEHFSKM